MLKVCFIGLSGSEQLNQIPSNHTIDNNGTLEELKQKIISVLGG